MNLVGQRNPRHFISEIDIQLWARELRRRWLTRTLGEASAKFVGIVAQAGLRPMHGLHQYAVTPLAADPETDRAAKQPKPTS